jgi:hypothetical protein
MKWIYSLFGAIWKFANYLAFLRVVFDIRWASVKHFFDFCCYLTCQLRISLHNIQWIRQTKNKRCTRVTHLRNFFNYRYFIRIHNSIICFYLVCEASSENSVFVIAASAFVICHIFNQSNCWNFKVIEHINSFCNIYIPQFLWSSYDNRARNIKFLC